MVHDTEQLLSQKNHEEEIETSHKFHEEELGTGKYGQLKDTENQCKKHGLLCRILTALHLKKRGRKRHDHQQLLSESQEQLAQSSSKKNKKKKSKKIKDKSTESESEPKRITLSLPKVSTNRNNNNANNFATTYEKLDNVSLNSEELIPIDIEFWDMENESAVSPLPHEILHQSVHMYGDDKFGERQLDRPQDKYALLNEKDLPESHSAGDYLKHQWKGKRAKKARKVRTYGL